MTKTTIIYSTKDTFISPINSSKLLNFGKHYSIYVGNNYKSLLYFNLSSIPANAIITSAKLYLYMFRKDNLDSKTLLSIKELDNDFYECTVNATTQPSSTPLVSVDTCEKEITSADFYKVISFDNLTQTVTAIYKLFLI